jgi:hypothetical protein
MRASLVVLVTGALLASGPPLLQAQQGTAQIPARGTVERYFDYFVNHRLDVVASEREAVGGFGGRMMWSLSPGAEPVSRSLAERVALGGYIVHMPAAPGDPEVWQYGTQADVAVSPFPIAGRIEPLVSLGLGAVRTAEGARPSSPPHIDGVAARGAEVSDGRGEDGLRGSTRRGRVDTASSWDPASQRCKRCARVR